MNTIRLVFVRLPHPYPNEPPSALEIWGRIRLEIVDGNDNVIVSLVDIEWDIKPLIYWFTDNRRSLIEEEFVIKPTSASIAKALTEFYDSVSGEDDSMIDEVHSYRTRHGMRFALRGTDILDTYIGKLKGMETVSCYSAEHQFNYPVNLNVFFSGLIA